VAARCNAKPAAIRGDRIKRNPYVNPWTICIECRWPEKIIVDVPVAPCFPGVAFVPFKDKNGILRHM
jgi:hypothetical protein